MSLRTLCMSALALTVVGGLIFAQAPRPSVPRWTRQETQTIDRIAHAYYASETRSVLEMLSRLVARIGDAKVASLDKDLSARQLPDVPTLLMESRLRYVQQGLTRQLPKPSPHEAILVLRTMTDQIGRTLGAKAEHPLLSDPIEFPTTSEGWISALWKLHVLENELETARLLADYAPRVATAYPAGAAIKLSESDRKLIQTDHSAIVSQVQQAIWDVEDREIELRIARLRNAIDRLEDPSLDGERFLAAYTAELDSRIVTDFFERLKKGERRSQSASLIDEDTRRSTLAQVKRARELGKDLPYKAALFYEGLHWWLRGRYGMGPDAGGLAKSEEALRSPSAQFGLYMPSETPKPTNPGDVRAKQPVPAFDRRHHYWWAWEDRRLHRGTLGGNTRINEKENFSVTLSRFW